MRLAIILAGLIGFQWSVLAQQELPAFGKIDIADLELTSCSIDPAAAAFKLIDWGNIYYGYTGTELSSLTAMYERRVRIKILREPGLSYATISIPYFSYNREENITGIQAYTYNLAGNRKIKKTKVLNNAMYRRKINKHYSELIIVFPEVKTGSVVEYQYRLQSSSLGNIKDWYFQSSLPTRYSEFQVNMPSRFRYTIHPLTADSLEIREPGYSNRLLIRPGSILTNVAQKNFIMRNLRAIQPEPLMGSARDYLQRLSFRLSEIDYGNGQTVYINSEWEDVVNELIKDPHFGEQLDKKLPELEQVILQTLAIPDRRQRMAFIYKYVQQQLQWNGTEALYAYDGIKKTWQTKSGNSASINLLLINLLKKAGLQVAPILFSTRQNGQVNTSLPLVKQFNSVMALVEDGQQYFILDATDKYSPYDLPPLKILNSKGFVVEADSGRWLQPVDTLYRYRVVTAVSGSVDTIGSMKGNVFITASGYAGKHFREDWVRNNSQPNIDFIFNDGMNVKIQRASVENLYTDSLPLEQKMDFTLALNQSGDHRYFNPHFISSFGNNPFLASERNTDIDFGYLQEHSFYGYFLLPEGYGVESLPQDVLLMTPDTSIIFRRYVTTDYNILNARITIEFKRSVFAASAYADVAAFYRLLLSKLHEPVILKKNPAL